VDASTAVVVAGGLSLVAAALSSWITSRVAGRANRTNAMLEWAKQLQASEQAARKEAGESRERAERIRDETDAEVESFRERFADLESKLQSANRLADRLTDTLTSVQAEIWRPQPDIAALRKLVGRPTGINGR
jgi:chromosome segregation ATPase